MKIMNLLEILNAVAAYDYDEIEEQLSKLSLNEVLELSNLADELYRITRQPENQYYRFRRDEQNEV